MTSRNSTPTCFLCCNVKVGALLKSFLFLFAGFMVMTVTILDKVGYFSYSNTVQDEYTVEITEYYATSNRAFFFVLLNGLFFLMVGLFGIIGVVKSKAKLLLPLLVVTVISLISHVCALFSIVFFSARYEAFVAQLENMMNDELKQWVMSLDRDWQFVFVFMYVGTALLIELLFVKSIYGCYRHFSFEEATQRRVPEVAIIGVGDEEASTEGPIYKLPKYEDLQKAPLVENEETYPTKPPAYEA